MRRDAELLADRYRSYLVDPPGSGGSTTPRDPGSYDHLGHARFYDEVRRVLGLDTVTVYGVSFGGTVALTYSALFPNVATRCVAVSPFGLGSEVNEAEGGDAEAEMKRALAGHAGAPWFAEAMEVWDSWTARVLSATSAAEAEHMMRICLPLYCAHPDKPEVRTELEKAKLLIKVDLAAMKAWEGGLYQRIDLRPLLEQIKCPVLIVAGELDLICGPAQARRIAEKLPNGTLVLIPDCGHLPAVEVPQTLRSSVIKALQQHGAEAGRL